VRVLNVIRIIEKILFALIVFMLLSAVVGFILLFAPWAIGTFRRCQQDVDERIRPLKFEGRVEEIVRKEDNFFIVHAKGKLNGDTTSWSFGLYGVIRNYERAGRFITKGDSIKKEKGSLEIMIIKGDGRKRKVKLPDCIEDLMLLFIAEMKDFWRGMKGLVEGRM